MEVNQKDQDVLLVNETGSTKLNVVAGLGEDGMLNDNITPNVPVISLTNVPGVSLTNEPGVSPTNVPQ